MNSRFLSQKITGTQRFAIELSRHIKKICSDVNFIAPKNILHENLGRQLNVKTMGINEGHIWEQFDLPIYLKKQGNPLLLNLANTAPLFYRNQIVSILDMSFWEHSEWFSKEFVIFYKYLIPRVVRKSSKIITISNFSKNRIKKLLNIDENKIEVIYCGISDIFSIDKDIHKEDYILCVSSIDPRKNLKNLILAFKKLNLKNYKLLIVGSENKVFSNLEIKNLVENTRNIEFTGYISDEELVNFYRKAKLFVYPSFYEGFGIPPLEAMACGTPVIVSNVTSLPEVCGDAAYYVNPYDVEDIAKGIYTVLKDEKLQKELIKKGLERVKVFSWEKSAKKLVKIIEEVA